MLIGEIYKIESDSLNFILYKSRIIKGEKGKHSAHIGETDWDVVGYFSNVKNALKYLVDHDIRGTGLADIETVSAKIDQLYNLIQNLKA